MTPIASNTADKGCSPVSSNCVIWQGPTLSCINVCTGDSVSDVVYKLALQVCALQANAGLSDLDLTALVNVCQTSPTPAHTLSAILELLISKVVCLSDIVKAIPVTGTPYSEPSLALPTCLQYVNTQGVTVTSLLHNQYTLTLATKICALNSSVNTLTTQVGGLNTRVTALENKTAAALPTVVQTCLTGDSTAVALDAAVAELTTSLCSLKAVLGTDAAITTAVGKQCTSLASLPAIGQTGTMSTIPGWKTTVSTMSDGFTNLWLTVCDMRNAINDLKNCCNSVDCTAVMIDFLATLNVGRDQLTINFNNLTSYKAALGLDGFSDCYPGGAVVTITDTAGHVYTTNVLVVTNATNPSGVTITFPVDGTNQLNSTLNYTVKMEACVTKNGVSCSKTITKTLNAACTTITITSATIS